MARFGRVWPGKWNDLVTQAGGLDAITEEWRTGLAGLDGDAITQALEHCRRSCAWPPSIAEFRAAAVGGANAEQRAFQRRLAEADAEQRALPSETWAETRARGTAHLQALKAQLGGA